jgi:rubrerythrin
MTKKQGTVKVKIDKPVAQYHCNECDNSFVLLWVRKGFVGPEFTDLFEPKHCPYCGVKLEVAVFKWKSRA